MANRTLPAREATPIAASTKSMGSTITILAGAGEGDRDVTEAAMAAALDVFRDVDRCCTRFSPTSPLMRANTAGNAWHAVGATCFAALRAAYAAHLATGGRFDPRVHDDLVRLGYDRSMRSGGISPRGSEVLRARSPLPPWTPEFRDRGHRVRLGAHAIDLGGIGKGFAVSRAAGQLDQLDAGYLIDAGGDCWCRGQAPDGGPWRLAVEDPYGGPEPVAVLALRNIGVATSSIRIGQWQIAGTAVHHLIDPETGQPGGSGLAAVTVVAADTSAAEIWSKVLFLEGCAGIAAAAHRLELPALWIDTFGALTVTAALEPHVMWRGR